WIPALRSDELVVDGAPIRLRLLGENLVAFRSTNGQVGLLDHRCPHRCASLFFGRNEEGGLRCVYHGWKFDANGQCVDMPGEPPESDFKNKVRTRSYPCLERSGLVWAYLGPREEPPPLPALEASMLSEEERMIQPAMRACNWLQALEGDIDTSHFGFLHMGSAKPEDFNEGTTAKYYLADRAPRYEVVSSASGTMCGAVSVPVLDDAAGRKD
ncbi:MAG TPA: (2Fe-2S)-binding protein, partial [candidate division Zixibacteria bacterium]|nr:(2Fe-2S)-binding protein [candidate division Zixibacteria bacterium]